MLQFQEVLSIYKIEFWCELTIAILIWENVDLCFGKKYTLASRLARLEKSVGHQTITDRNKCLTDLKLFQSGIVSERKMKIEMEYLYNVRAQA